MQYVKMTKQYDKFYSWRKRAKKDLVAAFGGKCGICGYSKCIRNLSFHHLGSENKDFGISLSGSKSWKILVAEARKCVLLCANCHGEVHDSIATIPENCPRFDERFSDIHCERKRRTSQECLNCNELFKGNKGSKFCSAKCFGQHKRKNPKKERFTKEQIFTALCKTNFVFRKAAKELNCSDTWLKKMAIKHEILVLPQVIET